MEFNCLQCSNNAKVPISLRVSHLDKSMLNKFGHDCAITYIYCG